MVTEDWMMRQVETMARSIAMLVFHKEDTAYVPAGDAEADGLHRELMRRLEAGVDFYARLNELSDARLEEAGFGRGEIQEGLRDLSERFGVVL